MSAAAFFANPGPFVKDRGAVAWTSRTAGEFRSQIAAGRRVEKERPRPSAWLRVVRSRAARVVEFTLGPVGVEVAVVHGRRFELAGESAGRSLRVLLDPAPDRCCDRRDE